MIFVASAEFHATWANAITIIATEQRARDTRIVLAWFERSLNWIFSRLYTITEDSLAESLYR